MKTSSLEKLVEKINKLDPAELEQRLDELIEKLTKVVLSNGYSPELKKKVKKLK
jgi:hypothetical protein